MTDFRIPVTPSTEIPDYDQELDWEKDKSWKLSEREAGLGQKWVQGMKPSPDQLQSLLEFFRIEPERFK